MALEDQIRQRWGQFGDWKSADQDQVAALATLLSQNGVTDLSQFQLRARDYTIPGTTEMQGGDAQHEVTIPERSGTAFDAFYGDKQLSYLGDINRDGSYTSKAGVYDEQGPLGRLASTEGVGGDLLGWSAAGDGNTGFQVMKGPGGEPVVVPVWGSSSADTYADIRGIASILALAAGGYYAGAGGTTGAAAQGGLQGAAVSGGSNMLFGDGDVDSLSGSILSGAATGAAGGGLKAYGAEQGWNPAITKAATQAGTTLARGGSIEDAGTSALGSSLGTLTQGLTGNSALDQALASGARSLIKGGSGSDALTAAALSGAGGLLGSLGGQNNLADGTGDALSADNIVRFDGGSTVSSPDFDWDQWVQDQISGSNLDTTPTDFNWSDLGVTEPDYSNEGRNYPTTESTQGPGGSPVNASNSSPLDALRRLLGTNIGGGANGGGLNPLAALLGGALGASSSRDSSARVTKDPWAPAVPALTGLIKDGTDLYGDLKANPFSQAQQTAYGNFGGLLDLINTNAAGLLAGPQANAMGTNQFTRGQPARLQGSTFNPTPEQWAPGLLGSFGTRKG